ncbi:TPA: 50S ribosomal protein L6 [Patescibacteria group bacterium]|uniref:Large ribosomal subunit protein uL6 n=1 Tax=Candidatus Gottesmanbacteria bacterium GW2011_GWA1_43_11 TaxID=1618436 RepID=A0A0G1CFR4_9BACT|nr:MAG: 50S ribosomal protein L6 [Candidatus Gottesmanbacteria bacterium GW2011_GWA1_43_11]HCS78726.1 50S ribosomal protein L6 [Patescibacteria group bacterium]
MSRIGKQPVELPAGVTVTQQGVTLMVRGAKGTVSVVVPQAVAVKIADSSVQFEVSSQEKDIKSLHGLVRSLVKNAVLGVSKGWEKQLELVGVGYRVAGGGNEITLTVGFSHPVKFTAPQGVTFTLKDNKILVSGIDKKIVGEVAAQVRHIRPPEPYKGKGIRYVNEVVRRKAGKAVKAAGAAA